MPQMLAMIILVLSPLWPFDTADKVEPRSTA